MKRLESSWYSFKLTVENILNHHTNALEKAEKFIKTKQDSSIDSDLTGDEQEEIEETAAEINGENEEPITLGRKNPIVLSSIAKINLFKKHLEADDKLHTFMITIPAIGVFAKSANYLDDIEYLDQQGNYQPITNAIVW